MAAASFNCNSHLDSVHRDVTEDPGDLSLLDVRFIVVGRKCRSNKDLEQALQHFECPVEYADSAMPYINDDLDFDTIFVLEAFEGTAYHSLHRAGARIMAPPVLIRFATGNEPIPNSTRPLYNTIMRDLVLCFTGFKRREQLSILADLVHHMGGSIRKDFSPSVTHVVANCTGGEKYRAAVSRGRAIMSEDWVHKSWDMREDSTISATDPCLENEYKLSPFSYTCLSFHGFPKDEQRHMEDVTIHNGGTYAEAGAPNCTHLVVEEHNVKSIPFETHPKLYIVKSEWFWASIQMDACADESMYIFKEETIGTPNSTTKSGKTTPGNISGGKNRKRKRLKENLAQLANIGDVDSPIMPSKRKSNDAALMSMSASLLDVTADNSNAGLDHSADALSPPPVTPVTSKPSARWEVAMELLQTETNYVGILSTIVKTMKNELENPDQPGGAVLPPTEIKLIFGNLPPIYEIHSKMQEELNVLLSNWNEDHSIGNIILKHADSLQRSYPKFVNFFENTKETIIECEKKYPRFHAFLKVCQNRPECGRQTLTELFIRPVQRLPSIILLLKDILKKTDDHNPDHQLLKRALGALDDVLKHINEDRRKTEGQIAMLTICNDIDNFPPSLLSSHRNFVTKVDAIDLTNTLSGKGDPLTLFLFSDSLELCKRRVRNSKSPHIHGSKTPQKPFKHLEMLQLASIKRVVDIFDEPGIRNVFALIVRSYNDKDEKLYAFQLVEDTIDKEEFLTMISKYVSNFVCGSAYEQHSIYIVTDWENLMTGVTASVLHIEAGDLQGNRTLSRAASKFGKRVSRAFSFNKTPRRLKRAVSSMTQMISPFRRENSLSSNPDSPHGNLYAMRLASTNDLSDLDSPVIVGGITSPDPGFRTPNPPRRMLKRQDSTCTTISTTSTKSVFL